MAKAQVYRYLARRYKYTIDEIANMTLYQQLVLCEGDEEDGSSAEQFPGFDPDDPDWLSNAMNL